MAKVLWTVALAAFVAWGATVKPGRPFSWTMYSGSSKAFLWIGEGKGRHVARYEELRLAPDNHYLSVADLQALVSGRSDLDSLQGFVIGSHGSWFVTNEAEPGRLAWRRLSELPANGDLLALSKALGRAGCRQA